MTEAVQPLDTVLTWKDVGDGAPAQGLIVEVGEGDAEPAVTGREVRVTPEFVFSGGVQEMRFPTRPQDLAVTDPIRVTAGNSIYLAGHSVNSIAEWYIAVQLNAAVLSDTSAAVRTLVEATGTAGTVLQNPPALIGLNIGPNSPLPSYVIAAAGLSPGATFPDNQEVVTTLNLSWNGLNSFNDRIRGTHLLAIKRPIEIRYFANHRFLVLPIANSDIIFSSRSRRSGLSDYRSRTPIPGTLTALPVNWTYQGAPTVSPEGPFTARRLFARRDDSQVETVNYSTDDDGNTVATVRRATDFIVRRDTIPPVSALLSEFDTWDGSRPVWSVETVEHLDRARFARLRCSEFVVV